MGEAILAERPIEVDGHAAGCGLVAGGVEAAQAIERVRARASVHPVVVAARINNVVDNATTARASQRWLDTGRYAQALELDWLQQAEVAGIRITALPAIHFSKRGLLDRNASLWCGFLLEAAGRKVLFTGDTAYGPVFAETAPRMTQPDLALVPIGAYEPRPLMAGSHCTPEEGVAIGRAFGAKRLCAMHWGTILLTDEPAFEPPVRFRAAAMAEGYAEADAWTLAIGETRALT